MIHPVFFPGMNLCGCPHEGCTSRVNRKGWKPFRQVYGVMNNKRTISPQYICDFHKAVFPTTDSYWSNQMPWQQGGQNNTAYGSASGMMKSDLNTGKLPHFTSKAALTRELYDMIVEFRTTCHFGQLEEGLKREPLSRVTP